MKWWASLRPPVRGSIVMVLVAALVLGIVWSRTRPDDPSRQAEPGRVTGVRTGNVGGPYFAIFEIPNGEVHVSLNLVVGELKDDGDPDEAQYRVHRPPPGGRVVEVGWSGESGDDELTPDGLKSRQLPGAKLTLRSGSQRELLAGTVKLASSHVDSKESATYAFDSREPIVATLEFAGRRQSVDLLNGHRKAGAFASLYRPSESAPTELFQERLDHRHGALRWQSDLNVADQRSPYLAGLGWARKGREWLVLAPETRYGVSLGGAGRTSAQGSDRHEPKPVGSVQVKHGRLARKSSARAQMDNGRTEYEPSGAVFEVPSGEPARLGFTIRIPLKAEGSATPGPLVAERATTVTAMPGGGARAL